MSRHTFTAQANIQPFEQAKVATFVRENGQDKSLATTAEGVTLIEWKSNLVGLSVESIVTNLLAAAPDLYESADDVHLYDLEKVVESSLKKAGLTVTTFN